MFKIFVDGEAGTTGLQIRERLSKRSDLEILSINPDLRKDVNERQRLINASDVTFLCLPDAAAVESAALCTNPGTRIIDASTAHRVNPDWTYGIPELSPKHREAITKAKRIANPGCHASGFILGVYPLVSSGILPRTANLAAYSITGYSGGGKKLIAEYEEENAMTHKAGESASIMAPAPYALALAHKHLPEMKKYCQLEYTPFFNPVLGPFYKGMAVTVAIFENQLTRKVTPQDLTEILFQHYQGSKFIKVMPYEQTPVLFNGRLDPTVENDTNNARIQVFGNENVMQVTTIIDNLGKGASGAAIQNMNIALGLDETLGL
ncbi:MAG: N-acetyl-gamma-glutamyl-phosphate reductase [Fibrobacteraceae bacterium]|nr:N-acetyl-gamma-glutamyl-phosphate reductase [Fibrobacteraceae bacterium]